MKNSFFLAILLVFAICSCKSTTLGPNAETATIKGQASIAANYAQYTPPYNGITVSLIGTSFSAMTDDSGNFEIDNVPSGTYDVRFSKPGYGDVLWFGKIVMGGGNASINWKTENDDPYVRYPTLYKQPNLALHLESASFTDTTIKGYSTSNALVEKGHYSGATPMSYGGIVSYVSRKSNVSSIPGHYNSFFYHYYPGEEELYDTNSHIFLEPIDVSTLRDIGFTPETRSTSLYMVRLFTEGQ